MKAMIRPAVSLFVLLTVVTGVLYPLAVTGVAKAAFPHQAAGSLIVRDGKTVGSSLIGQNFSDPKYFWGRPSATSPMASQARGDLGFERHQRFFNRRTGVQRVGAGLQKHADRHRGVATSRRFMVDRISLMRWYGKEQSYTPESCKPFFGNRIRFLKIFWILLEMGGQVKLISTF